MSVENVDEKARCDWTPLRFITVMRQQGSRSVGSTTGQNSQSYLRQTRGKLAPAHSLLPESLQNLCNGPHSCELNFLSLRYWNGDAHPSGAILCRERQS